MCQMRLVPDPFKGSGRSHVTLKRCYVHAEEGEPDSLVSLSSLASVARVVCLSYEREAEL